MKKLITFIMFFAATVRPSENHKCHITSNGSILDNQRTVIHYDDRVEVSYFGSNIIDVYYYQYYQPPLLVVRYDALNNKHYRYHGPEKMPSYCKLSYFEN